MLDVWTHEIATQNGHYTISELAKASVVHVGLHECSKAFNYERILELVVSIEDGETRTELMKLARDAKTTIDMHVAYLVEAGKRFQAIHDAMEKCKPEVDVT